MLKIRDVYKTFNRGTVNEKVAINGLDLTLEDGDFVTVIGWQRRGQVHDAQPHRRRVSGGFGQDHPQRPQLERPAGA